MCIYIYVYMNVDLIMVLACGFQTGFFYLWGTGFAPVLLARPLGARLPPAVLQIQSIVGWPRIAGYLAYLGQASPGYSGKKVCLIWARLLRLPYARLV